MFKKYLRIQPAPIQLVIMLAFWTLLFLLGQFLTIFYYRVSWGVTSGNLSQFIETGIYQHPNALFVSQAVFQLLGFLAPALIYAYLADPHPGRYLGMKRRGTTIQILLMILLGISVVFFVSPLGSWLKSLDLGASSKALDEQRDKFISAYLANSDFWATVRNIFLIAVVPAICEEFFFRGLVMKFAHSFVPRWWFSIGLSALVFAAFHASVSEFVPIFIAGIILGTVYYLTSSLWMPVLLHLLVNGIQAWGSMYSNPAVERSLSDNRTVIILFIVATLLVLSGLLLLYKKRTPLPPDWSIVVPEE